MVALRLFKDLLSNLSINVNNDLSDALATILGGNGDDNSKGVGIHGLIYDNGNGIVSDNITAQQYAGLLVNAYNILSINDAESRVSMLANFIDQIRVYNGMSSNLEESTVNAQWYCSLFTLDNYRYESVKSKLLKIGNHTSLGFSFNDMTGAIIGIYNSIVGNQVATLAGYLQQLDENSDDPMPATYTTQATEIIAKSKPIATTEQEIATSIIDFVNSVGLSIIRPNNMAQGGLEYVISDENEGYYNTSFGETYDPNSYQTPRQTIIHYDESLSEEFEEVFVDSTTGQSYLNAITTTVNSAPETGIVFDIILPSTIIVLVAFATIVVWKKKEQY